MGGCQSVNDKRSESIQAKEQEVKEESSVEKSKIYNEALVFIKPHAVNDQVISLVKEHLAANKVKILSQGEISGKDIDAKGIIDSHYSHIAQVAMKMSPADLVVHADKKTEFEQAFEQGAWDDLIQERRILNLAELRERNGKSFDEIESNWRQCKTFKLAPGTYVGFLEDEDVFVLNAFYGVMRQVYTDSEARVVYFTVRFEENEVSWKDFRGQVIGATDPTKAKSGSLRAKILSDYQHLGLSEEPNMGKNGVHASAGPVEGLRERMVWLNRKVEDDAFGKAVLQAHVSREFLDKVLENDQVTIDGETGNAFDLLEDVDSSQAIQKLVNAACS